MYDIISIGDTTVDVFLELDEASVQCDLDKTSCRLCINYADKIPVKRMSKINAVGNAANHAVGATRLGLKTALVSIVGDDDSGHASIKQLKKEGVVTSYVARDPKRGTNYSTVIDYKGERTILVYHEHRDYRWRRIPAARWVYFTSMAAGHESLYPSFVRFVKRTGAQVGFNPGTFQIKLGADGLQPILNITHALFVNKEEAVRLVGEQLADMKDLLRAVKTLGPKMAVVTDGQQGSYCFDGSVMYYLPIFEAPVVERTGCGDAYASGFLAALAYSRSVPEAMRWGSVNAAGVIQQIGAQAGLIKKEEMERQLAEHPEYQPVRMTG